MTRKDLEREHNAEQEESPNPPAPSSDGGVAERPFDGEEPKGEPARTVHHAQVLEVRDHEPAVGEREPREKRAVKPGSDFFRIQVHAEAGGKHGQEYDGVERDVRIEEPEENQVGRIADSRFGAREKRKSSVHVRIPEWKFPGFEGLTHGEPVREPVVHDVTGEDVVSDEDPPHRREFPV